MNKIKLMFLSFFLFTPLLAYIYKVFLDLPKTINHFYVYVMFVFGLFYVLSHKQLKYPKYVWFLLIYAFYRLIWLLIAAPDRHILTNIYYGILYFSIFFIIVIIYNTRFGDFNEKFIKLSLRVFKVTVIIAAFVSIIQVFYPSFLDASIFMRSEVDLRLGDLYRDRRSSIFGFADMNELGLSYLPLASVLIGFLLYSKNKKVPYFLALIGITALLSNTRYIMIGFILLSFQYLIFKKIKIKSISKYFVLLILIGVVLYYTIIYFGYNLDDWLAKRLLVEGSIQETSRYKAWFNFLIFFPQKMFFGTGVHLTEEISAASKAIGSSQIHVGYLSHLVSYGLVGSFFLFGFWFMLAKSLYKNARRTNYWGSFFAFLIFFWAQATLVLYSIFFYGLIFALIYDKYFQDKLNTINRTAKPSYSIVNGKIFHKTIKSKILNQFKEE